MTDPYLTFLRELRPVGSAQLDHLRTIPVVGEKDPDEPANRCATCGEYWYEDSPGTLHEWQRFHAGCREAPCDHCGKLTNTPSACFDCYHAPFGIGWMEDRQSAGW